MTWHDYQQSKTFADGDPWFTALIMAAMRKADHVNERKLRAAWPEVWDELQARYNAPGGYLPGEQSGSVRP